MDDQTVGVRIDVRNAAVAALVVEAARGDHAVEQMMWGAGGPGACGARRRRPGAGDLFLVFRRLAVAVERCARNLHPWFDCKRRSASLINQGPHRDGAAGKKHPTMQE